MRAAALASLPHVPCFAQGAVPPSGFMSCRLFFALHDDDEANREAAKHVWNEIYGMPVFFLKLPKYKVHCFFKQMGSLNVARCSRGSVALSPPLSLSASDLMQDAIVEFLVES